MAELLAGRYEIGPVLTSTALVLRHRGRDTQLDRDVTVTFLRQELAEDEASVGLFSAIISVTSELSHPGIVAVYDAGSGTFGDVPVRWAVGEAVDAPNVDEFSPTPQQAERWGAGMLDIAEQLVQAMQSAHGDGVVHGNLGPSTVLLQTCPDGSLRACVTGFGPQAADLAVLSNPAVTQHMWQAFTEQVEYPSPEQQAGRAPTRRSDIYGFGCVLAALLLHVERAPGGVDSDVARTAALARIAEQAMSEKPADRQHSFAVVGEQLRWVRSAKSLDHLGESGGDSEVSPPTMVLPFAPTARVEPAPATERLTYLPVKRVKRTRRARSAGSSRGRRSSPGGRMFAALTLVVLIVAGIGWGISQSETQASSASITIPSVAGQELGAATTLLGSVGLSLGGQMQRPDAIVPAGLVSATEPAAGIQVPVGHSVTLVISSGPDARSVPQLQALSLASAQEALAASGLVAGEIVQRDGLAAAGSVLDSDPPFGTLVSAGVVVDIVVASGNQRVPSGLPGQAGVAASQQLAAAGLAPQLLSRPSSDVATGVVIEVIPGEGSSVPLGTIVTLVVAEYTPRAADGVPTTTPTTALPTKTPPSPTSAPTSKPTTFSPTSPAAQQDHNGDG
ncbi:PASTA domain-containing protein [Agreia bicolorata]|uniref:non-specific serine/threonine protein kinase n=1 Tax=Agreia bicolorata TaxID=110935 RepID=A0ABR5CD82_9MICO|nr:PASTA domain-containing protein [Agreia bicolorata]KJC63590.1 hypothetical protein TZ00_13730 [Agreia bicolorata]